MRFLLLLTFAVLSSIASARAGDDIYVLATDGKLWREHDGTKERELIDENVKSFFVKAEKDIEVLSTDGKLWREHGTRKNRELITTNVKESHVEPNPDYRLENGELRRKKANDWEPVDKSVQAFQAKDDTLLYVLGADEKLWKMRGNWHTRLLIDEHVAAFQIVFH